jgi:hypothetical protein
MNFQEPERETESVPPEMHSGNVGKHGINVVNVALNHEWRSKDKRNRQRVW